MTEDQRLLLDRRLREAAEQQPEILVFRTLLLGLGGDELVPPPSLDVDIPILMEKGAVVTTSVVSELVEKGRCHENVSELWLEKKAGLVGIGVGYALSPDGLWRRHSWGARDGELVETTEARIQYFGRVLEGADAQAFAEENRGDPQERYWRRLPEVWFRLQKDEDGYPPKDWEGLKAEQTGDSGSYRIKSVPFFARQIAYEDEVTTGTSEEGLFQVFQAVSKRSGYSVVRLFIKETEDSAALTDYFTSKDCLVEFKGRLVAIAIPKAAFEEVLEFIGAEKDSERWDTEDGYLIIDG